MSARATLFIGGPLPGMNEMIAAAHKRRGKWDGYGELKRDWGQRVWVEAKRAKLQQVDGPVSVYFVWREKDRRRDIDNIAAGAKFVLDGLVKAGVIAGDGQKDVFSIDHRFQVDAKAPGVLVTVESACPF